MPSEGPTVAGSITAKIGATVTEFRDKIAEAKALAKDLTTTPTNVKVGADTSEAIAKLSAVEAAQRKVGLATDNLKLAYQRLDDAQASGNVSAGRKMAMDLALTKAEYGLTDALRSLAAAQAAETVAEDDNTEATKRSNTAQKEHLQRWQKIALAVAALVPLLGPLAGYAAGVTGALGAMGVAGVLAIVGIKNAMEQGTATGSQYAAGLQTLKGNLNELGGTAADAMLDSYNRAIGQINASMPFLNSSTRLFSQQLGVAGNLLLGGLLTGLKVIQPLLLTAGVYVQQLAAGFLSWTKNGGLQTFTQYAIAQLPKVAQALGQLAQLAMRFIEATSPIGTVVISALTGVATALNAMPLPVLTALIAGGGAFFLAYKAWAALSPILEAVSAGLVAVGVAEDIALGPIGLVVAGVTAIGAAVGITAISMQNGTQAIQDYTAALQQDNGVIGEHTRQQAANTLSTTGALEAAKQLGISGKLVTDATLGNAQAQSKLSKELDKIRQSSNEAAVSTTATSDAYKKNLAEAEANGKALTLLTSVVDQNKAGVKDAITAYNELQKALGGTTISTKQQLQAEQDNAHQYGASISTYEAAKASQKQSANQLAETTVEMQLQNDAAGLLRQALDTLNKKRLDYYEAQTSFAAANNNVTDSFKQNGRAIDDNSKQSVANQQAIQQSVEAAQAYAEAVGAQTGSTDAANKSLADSKQALEDNLAKYGNLTPSVQAYIDKVYAIPTTVKTSVDIDTAVAALKIQQLAKDIVSLSTTYNQVTARMPGSIAVTKAMGGTIGGFANGGTIPGFANGGGPSGTVFGPGSSTSDSILTRLSVGEEVTKASSANFPGVRGLLKQLNYDPPGTMAALTRPTSGPTYENHLHVDGAGWNVDALFAEFSRRMSAQQNARTA